MLARPFASDTVTARETCRLKCSVVTNVAAGPDAGARAAAGASGPKARVAMPRSVTLTARTGRDGGTPRRRSRGGRGTEHRGVCRVLQTCVECALAAHDSHPCQTLGCPRDRPVVHPGRRVRDERRRPAHAP